MNPFVKAMKSGARGALRILALVLIAAAPAAWAGVTVTLTNPTNGSLYTLSPYNTLNITLSASASADQGYTLSKVEFFNGTTLIGTDTTSPYSITWNNVPSGNYALTAKATAVKKNSPNLTATSSVVNTTVTMAPVITLTSPVGGTSYTIPLSGITVSATASDSDGSIAAVAFYDCMATFPTFPLLASVNTPPYSFVWTLEPPYWEFGVFRRYEIMAVAIDNLGAQAATSCAKVYAAPTVALTSPANGTALSAPAIINLAATISPADAPIEKIQFFNGTTLIGEVWTPPYSFSWQNVPVGNYSLSARVRYYIQEYDWTPAGAEQASSPVNVTVSAAQPKLHFIHVDHLNTPRLVADAAGTTVWRWDQGEPFGVNVPDENPSGLGAFDLPLRLPGQYYDKETNLHYNYFRDYDPSLGRYAESDPIGLDGGLNTYAYALGSPIVLFDKDGLLVRLCSRPLSRLPWRIGPLRHDFIDLNGYDWGLHCDGCGIWGPGVVRTNVERRPFQNCMEWDCIDEQKLITNILASQRNPPDYNVLCANCQTWAVDMLVSAFDKSKCTTCKPQ